MKNILIFLLVFGVFLSFQSKVHAKISAAPLTDLKKATMTYGYKGVFCKVEKTSTTADELLTLYFGDPPADHYENLFSKAQCTDEESEFLIGETTLDYYGKYFGDYSHDETFIIKDGKMYRAGLKFFSYYEDRSLGGSYKSMLDDQLANGLETIGSSYFFNSDYDKDATIGARLEQSGYIKHFSKDGSVDWTMLAFNNEVFKLKTIIKQEQDVVLLDDTVSKASPTPEPTADWESYTSSEFLFSFQYPSSLVYQYGAIDDASMGYGGLLFSNSDMGTHADSTLSILVEPKTQAEYDSNIDYIISNPTPGSQYSEHTIYSNQKRITLDNMPAFVYSSEIDEKNGMPAPGSPLGKYNNLLFQRNGYEYSLSYKSANINAQNDEFDQILSTFKFIEITPTPEPVITLSPEDIEFSASLDETKQNLVMTFSQPSLLTSFEYEANYSALENGFTVERGVIGNVQIPQSPSYSHNVVMGACANEDCKYDTVAGDIYLTLRVVLTNGDIGIVQTSVPLN